VKCEYCGNEVEVSLEEAGRVLGERGGKVKGKGKGRKLSRERAKELVRLKYEKRHRQEITV